MTDTASNHANDLLDGAGWLLEVSSRLNDACIFVVEDNLDILMLTEFVLRRAGYHRLELISDPREVVPRYQQTPADLILLDLNMPYMSGYDVVDAINALNEPVPPPIIMLTAQTASKDVVQAFRLGVRDYITKPFENKELTMRVRNLLSAHLAHHMLHDQVAMLKQLVSERTQALNSSRLEVLQRLGRAAEYRDNETGLHTSRMCRYAALLARSLGWSEVEVEQMLQASPMHDVGKIGIPDHILLKAGRLDDQERAIMKRHVEIGAKILSDSDCIILQMARTIALYHHEKWDGTGYPHELAGTDIPQSARIVAVVDVFDALTSSRPYKSAWSVHDATAYIQNQAGTHFDPEVVTHFMRILPEILDIKQQFADPENYSLEPTAELEDPPIR